MSTLTTASRLNVAVTPPTARVRLNHPPLNVIDIAMMEELAESLRELDERPDITAIVLSGEGKAFSAGVDVAAHTPDKIEEMLQKFHTVIRALVATKKITVAAVHGHCLGGGAELAIVCDLVYTTDSAQWGFPEIKLGCYPPVACTALASLIGQKRASELILTGRIIHGHEVAEWGLANYELPEKYLARAVDACLGNLGKLSPAVLAITKKASYAWDSMHFDKGLARAERIYLDELIKTHDAHEGLRAFMEKREPRWAGK